MATTRKPRSVLAPRSAALRTGSWMALLAATTLGIDGAKTVRAEVKADATLAKERDYRLVVHSYDSQDGIVPTSRVRPVASYQRAVTAAELREGVQVSLVELRNGAASKDGSVVAWIEAGKPDLEFDGRTARPMPGSIYGLAKRAPGVSNVQIRLSRRAA